jgi:hypothetical protein
MASRLLLKGHKNYQFNLNITQFRSVMNATITSVQTRPMLQHFPVRCGQPDVQFTALFASQADRQYFQYFVRDHQVNSQTDNDGTVKLWWPERNINNWTGFITDWHAVERRFTTAQAVTFGVLLVDSMMSTRTYVSSYTNGWQSIWGPQVPSYVAPSDSILQPPSVSPSTINPPSIGNPGL